jgi:hypothetical protein
MLFFEESLEAFTKRTGLSADAWRAAAEALWQQIRTSPHYHGGMPCAQYHCDRYLPRGSMPLPEGIIE